MASLISNEKYALYYQKISLLYKRPEIRASLEVILSIFTVMILIFAAIRPTLVNIASLQKKITDQEAVNKKADTKMSQLLSAETQLTTYASSLNLYDAAVPDNYSYFDSAERLEYLARTHNLSFDSESFMGSTLLGKLDSKLDWAAKVAVPDANNIITDKVSFTVSGKPQDVINFLDDIENMERLAEIDTISLSKITGQTSTQSELRASGEVTFYFYSTQ